MPRLSELIAPHFHETFSSNKVHQIDSGGRGSTKTSKNCLKVAWRLINDSNCNVVAIRKNKNTLRDSLYAEIKLALSRLGFVENVHYEALVSPMRIRLFKNDNTVFFGGMDNYEKLKGMIGNSKRKDGQQAKIKILYFSEITEFKGEEEINQTVATFSRGNKEYFFVLYEYNPPKNKYHWVNKWTEEMAKDENNLVKHTDYTTVPKDWLGKIFIDEAKRLEQNDFEQYRHVYLGEVIGLEGLIYNWDLFQHIDSLKGERIINIDFFIDAGHQISSTTFLAVALTTTQKIILLDTYYYSPNGKSVKKAPSELSNDLKDFITSVCAKYKAASEKIIIDSAEGALRNQFFKDYGVRITPAAKGTNEDMWNCVQELLGRKSFYILDNENNKIFALEHKNYEYKEGSVEANKPVANKEEKKVQKFLKARYYNTHSKTWADNFAEHTCDALKYGVIMNKRKYNLKY